MVLLVSSAFVAAIHFRPYQGGLLEDWGLALAWESEGLAGWWARLPGVLGRPLHLVPAYLGLVLTDGGFVGQYAVLAAVAVAQVLVGTWALRTLGASWVVGFALSFALATHPWWAAGDVLRFAPAQVSVLTLAVWLGAAATFARGGTRRWLLVVVAAPVVGLLTYQAPAPAFLVGGFTVAVSLARPARGVVLVAATAAAVVASLTWTAVIAPVLSPASYEAQFLGAAAGSPTQLVYGALRTMALHGKALVPLAVVAGVLVVGLGLAQRLTPARTWWLLGAIAASPAAALVYAANPLHLRDPERVVLPVALTLWVVIAAASVHLPERGRLATALVTTAVVGGVVGGVAGYLQWTADARAQEDLISAVGAVRDDVVAGSTIVVADSSGRYGDVYTLLPPHLSYAVEVEYGPGPAAELCTPAGVVRQQPVAELFPLGTTPDCAALLSSPGVVLLDTAQTTFGEVSLYAVPPTTP